ncbi:MAG TPA: M56 family metallopeptidase [Longimicrobiales bacterium]|nr:M56 family metallopeptidase [Longimicrobiales bacterium]
MTTTGAWMAYGLVISGLLTVAALLAERAARNAGRPARGWWLAALGGSLLLPLVAWMWPGAAPGAAADPAFVVRLQPITIAPQASGGPAPGGILLYAWLATSLLMALLITFSLLRLRRLRRHWTEAEVEGEQVLVSGNVGPAVVGLRRARIVMPGWALGIDRELRRMLLLHEREHVRAHDPLLLAAGLAALVVAPWNPFVWMQFLRMRLAIELDCDARVLRVSGDARSYGTLLIEVGRQRSRGAALALAFGEPRSFLEERIRALPGVLGRRRLARAIGLASAALFVLLLAVCARDPMSSVNPVEQAGVLESNRYAADRSDDELMKEPTFTPFTARPELRNRNDVARALERNYPPLLREAGIGGEALVWFFIDRSGAVTRTAINRSTGYPALDSAALNVARTMEFTPAMNRDEPTPVWVAIPIVFRAGTGEAEGDVRMRRPADAGTPSAPPARASDDLQAYRAPVGAVPKTLAELESAPAFTPFDERPELTNRADVARALEENYPPLLRDAGIGGEALIWFLIAEDGNVLQLRTEKSSGHDALDRAALNVAKQMKFAPARLDDEPVPVWVAIPIVFSAR